jgi:hypothetical protein
VRWAQACSYMRDEKIQGRAIFTCFYSDVGEVIDWFSISINLRDDSSERIRHFRHTFALRLDIFSPELHTDARRTAIFPLSCGLPKH